MRYITDDCGEGDGLSLEPIKGKERDLFHHHNLRGDLPADDFLPRLDE